MPDTSAPTHSFTEFAFPNLYTAPVNSIIPSKLQTSHDHVSTDYLPTSAGKHVGHPTAFEE